MFMTQHEADCNCIDCLAKRGPFINLSENELETLQKNKHIVNYKEPACLI